MIRDGKVPIVGSGDNRRSMAYVDNICQGLLLCEKVDRAAGQVYWIADATSYSMNEIVETIERVMESSFGIRCAHRRLRLPNFVGNVAQVVDALLQRLGIYHQKIHVLGELNKTIACSIARAQAELGYAPTVSLEEGMRRSIEDMKQRGIEL
jgi:nucleoside-diphosphate-sugar epimerase